MKSKAVLVFLTDKYIRKASGEFGPMDNCKYEYDQCLLMKHLGPDQMIPVVMEPSLMSPRDWPDGSLKGRLGRRLFYNLSGDHDSTENQEELNRLLDELRTIIQQPAPPLPLRIDHFGPPCGQVLNARKEQGLTITG